MDKKEFVEYLQVVKNMLENSQDYEFQLGGIDFDHLYYGNARDIFPEKHLNSLMGKNFMSHVKTLFPIAMCIVDQNKPKSYDNIIDFNEAKNRLHA